MPYYDIDGNVLINVFDLHGNIVDTQVKFFINQCGYDVVKPKRATVIYVPDGTAFLVKSTSDDSTKYSGVVNKQIADFSALTVDGEYYIECKGEKSYNFKIAENRLKNTLVLPALKFMEMSRQDAWEEGGKTGYAWRDSHQFSFELNNLVLMYLADPDYWEGLPWDVYNVEQTEYTELRTQDCPNIIWLMKFAIMRYYDWNTNKGINLHALVKGQIAYFLYIYPYTSNYVDVTWYTTIRDWLISIWGVTTCNKSWYEVSGGINHSLYEMQSKIGTVKGQLPPGYAIAPNLMMYDVCVRDNLTPNIFRNSAQNNIEWLVNSVGFSNPAYTKGQRMNHYIPFHALTFAYETHPELCPDNTHDALTEAANVLISRSNNLWDYTQYSTKGDASGATETIWVNLEASGGLCNNPGYMSMCGVYLSLARIIANADTKARLKQLAIAHIDHGFGRNPYGRCFDFEAGVDFDNARLGWTERYYGGLGMLDDCVAVLDGSPKKESFPYNPSASTGYSEGWVAFNSAWNFGLAYLMAEDSEHGIGVFANG